MKKKGLSILLILLLVVVGAFLGIGLYYYLPMNHINLPEDVKTIKTEIYVSDIYGPHVCAEKVVESELEYEPLAAYIRENNKSDNIQIYLIYQENDRYVVWWDDYSTSLVNSIDGIEKEGMYYYLITNNTPYGSLFY
ncbi:MAG: hypothetical protein II994_04455 [Lachnospiraceae bacterium]|nr:hypothetical protein [Lachnospiraceae bacterium]